MTEKIIIEKITKSRIPNHCVLVLSNGEYVTSPIDTVLGLGLNKGSEISNTNLDEILLSRQNLKIKGYSMGLAAGFVRSEYQIRTKLKQKEFSSELIESTITRLKELNLINDTKFAENYINYSIKKKWGKNKISAELRKRGVSKDSFEIFLKYNYLFNDIYQNALETAQKKIRLISSKPLEKQKESIYRHLISKGFEYKIINEVTKEIFL